MKRYLPIFVIVTMLAGALLSACAAPTPQVVTVKETVVVSQEKIVQQTVVVEKEKIVEKERSWSPRPSRRPRCPRRPRRSRMGGTLNVWLPNGWPDKAWPYLTNWESTFAVSPMAERLFWPKPDGTLEPKLATATTSRTTASSTPSICARASSGTTVSRSRRRTCATRYWMHADPKLQPLGWIYSRPDAQGLQELQRGQGRRHHRHQGD